MCKLDKTNQLYFFIHFFCTETIHRPLRIKDMNSKKSKKKKGTMKLPHWMIYPTWALCLLTIFGSATLIVWYGIQFGNLKSLRWLTSVAIGIVSFHFVNNNSLFLELENHSDKHISTIVFFKCFWVCSLIYVRDCFISWLVFFLWKTLTRVTHFYFDTMRGDHFNRKL